MRTTARALLVSLACMLWTQLALAQSAAPRFEATPFVGYRVGGEFEVEDTEAATDRSIDLDDDGSFGLDLGLYRDPNSFYELLYSRQESGLNSTEASLRGLDITTEYLQVGGTLLFPDETWFVPWLSLTIGATKFDPGGGGYDSETMFSGSLGGGLRLPINERLSATLGLRGYLTLVDSNTEIFCVSSGGATCLLKTSGSTFFQGEAQLGLTVRF